MTFEHKKAMRNVRLELFFSFAIYKEFEGEIF
jgi:hypothetical protein